MKISVRVKTNSKLESVERLTDGSYLVRVRVPPIEGQANERTRKLLAMHFDSPPSQVEIISGFKGKKKIFEVKNR